MNPSDVKTNSDRLKVRDEYLAVLRQQEANLQKTANAIAVMNQTGQPPIQPTDMRSMNEKLVDIERLKPMFRNQLKSLMDSKEIEIVMNVLDNEEIQSAVLIFGEILNELKGKYPLGVPAPIFIEFLRRFLKDYNKSIGFLPKSKEERDALSGINALAETQNYIRQQQAGIERELENTSIAQDLRNQESKKIITENQRQAQYNQAFNLASDAEILNVAQNISGKTNPPSRTKLIAKRILGFDNLTPNEIFRYTNPNKGELISYIDYNYFRTFGTNLTSQDKSELANKSMPELKDFFTQLRSGENLFGKEELVEDIEQEVGSVMEGMLSKIETEGSFGLREKPTVAEVTEAMKLGTEAIKTGRSRGRPSIYASKEEARKAKVQQTKESKQRTKTKQQIEREVELESIDIIRELKNLYKTGGISSEEFQKVLSELEPRKKEMLKARFIEAGIPISKTEIPAYSGASEYQGLSAIRTPEKPEPISSTNIPDYMKITSDIFEKLPLDEKVNNMTQFIETNYFNTMVDTSIQKDIKALVKAYKNQTISNEDIDFALDNLFTGIRSNIREVIGFGMKKTIKTGASKFTKNLIIGRGLQAKAEKPKKEFSEKVDFSISTLPENKSYIPFGKYVLNQRRLNDNKLMIRTIKGGAVLGIPTLAISPSLGGIIKKMVGGALPSYNEMSKLSEEEQNTLYKIFKMSEVNNADLLPSPNKSKEEEEMNRFQILKGQVLAGNDSKELIKEFKVMLLKFIHNGKVPKGQGMEIICDLMAMGY